MNIPELTPAQRSFLAESIDGFADKQWLVELAGEAGSVRRFIRLRETAKGESYVLVVWDSRDEDWNYFLEMLDQAPGDLGLLPKVYAADPRHGLILEEDLGTETLRRYCMAHRHDMSAVEEQYRRTVAALARWHAVEPAGMPAVCARSMDADTFLWESGYFARRCVTDYLGLERLLDSAWEEERRRLAEAAARLPHVCMHRDFQSDNIMITRGEVRFIDFQGARLGPAAYDLASLLYDPYMELLTEPMVDRLFDCYTEQNRATVGAEAFRCCAMQRLMQAAGAYGYLSLHKGKDWFRRYIPRALDRLGLAVGREPAFPAIRRIVETCRESNGQGKEGLG